MISCQTLPGNDDNIIRKSGNIFIALSPKFICGSKMSYLTEKEKRNVIMTGTGLFIEGIRERDEPAGKKVPLTSWFYVLQNSVKVALQAGQFRLDNIGELGKIYNINLYTQPYFRQAFGRRVLKVAEDTGLDFGLKEDIIQSNIERKEARKAYQYFLDKEYEYAISRNLVGKSFDAHCEVIVWHLLNDIYNFPRPVGYEKKLTYDVIDSLSGIKVGNQKIWDPKRLEVAPLLVNGWIRALVETKKFDVLSIEEVGPMYSPPRFSEIDKRILFSGPQAETCRNIHELASRSPAWPIQATKENNDACFHLTSAGLIEYVSEKAPEIRHFGYVVPRDLFIETDVKLNYVYTEEGYKGNSDTTLTEQVFRTVGRARLAVNVLETVDFNEIDGKMKQLEGGEVESNQTLKTILQPLQFKGCIQYDKSQNKFHVVPGMENDISIMLDIWTIMDFVDLKIPKEEYARQKRAAQTRSQARKKALSLFRSL